MSDQSQGEGWWEASDGKWYPPPRPDVPATAPTATPTEPVTQPFDAPADPQAPPPYGPPTGPPLGSSVGSPPGGLPPTGGSPPAAQKSGIGRGPIIGIAAAVLVIIAAIAFFVSRGDGKSENVSASKTDQSDSSDQPDTDTSDTASSSKSSRSGSNKSSSSSSVAIPSGFKQLKNDTEGVSIAVPSDFKQIDPSAFADSSNESAFSAQNPDLAPFLASGNAFLEGSVLAATGATNGKPTVVVVAKSPQKFDPTDSAFTHSLKTELESAGAANLSVNNVSIPAGNALRVALSIDVNGEVTSGTVHEVLHFVTVGETTWGIIGASVGADASGLFDQMAKTFKAS
jgi:hypothetical protein